MTMKRAWQSQGSGARGQHDLLTGFPQTQKRSRTPAKILSGCYSATGWPGADGQQADTEHTSVRPCQAPAAVSHVRHLTVHAGNSAGQIVVAEVPANQKAASLGHTFLATIELDTVTTTFHKDI
eukprot:scaffold106042_cov42-Prasinocladus_malaysianus.AAC.6